MFFGFLTGSSALAFGCRDVSRFSTESGVFEGNVVRGTFVRSGIADDTRMCVTLDTAHLQDAPGALTTSDGRFRGTPMRPIPQVWHDPLSTFTFGEGRAKNLVYVATPLAGSGEADDVMVFVSLMEEGSVEVRLVRGAPETDAGVPSQRSPGRSPSLFGVFPLERHERPCSF